MLNKSFNVSKQNTNLRALVFVRGIQSGEGMNLSENRSGELSLSL